MIYDEKKFEEFYALAITDVSELEIGREYYSNYRTKEPLVVRELITYAEFNWRVFGDKKMKTANLELRWIRIGWSLFDMSSYISLRDNNVGASYNPWLLFANKADCDRCVKELTVRY